MPRESGVARDSVQRESGVRQSAHEETYQSGETKLAFKDRMSMTAVEEDMNLALTQEFTEDEYQVMIK